MYRRFSPATQINIAVMLLTMTVIMLLAGWYLNN